MKAIHQRGLSLAIISSIFLFSCEKKELIAPTENPITLNPTTSTVTANESLRTDFAKSLAKAMQEKEIRDFLKQEAAQMHDGDYDILYALVKDKKLASGKTFEQLLAKYAFSNEYDYTQWSKNDPLMTIFIPNLKSFTPTTWNTNLQIPDVAVDNSDLIGKTNTFTAFSADLRQYEVDAKTAPSFPTVVVKENERIIAKSKSSDASSKRNASLVEQKSTKVIAENINHSFYFIGNQNPKAVKTANSRTATYSSLPNTLMNFQNYYTYIEQRDWIYYHILPAPGAWGAFSPGYESGPLAPMYSEFVRGFKLASPRVLQAVSDNWTEGLLEFHVTIAFLYRDGTVNTDLKVFFCGPEDLMSSDGTMLEYEPNAELMPWDMQRYGDEWKLSILEHDPGGSVKQTVSASSNFGTNFEATSSAGALFVKVGVKFGLTTSFQKSSSTEISITSEDDRLGDVRFLYTDPIIVGQGPNGTYITKSITTGSVTLSVEPMQTYGDPRPPYDN